MSVALAETSTFEVIKSGLEAEFPTDLVNLVLAEYQELHRRFSLGDFRPSELSGGRYSEAVLRLCQHKCLGSCTPLGISLPNVAALVTQLGNAPSSLGDSWRLHIPLSLRLIYDLRNKRDVAHLGAGVSPNFTDSTIVLAVANWTLAEAVRITHQCPINEAQRLIDALVQRRLPLIYEVDDVFRILRPEMSASTKTLLVLYHFSPRVLMDDDLARKIEYKNLSRYRTSVLADLHKRALINHENRQVRVLPTGMRVVEELGLNSADLY